VNSRKLTLEPAIGAVTENRQGYALTSGSGSPIRYLGAVAVLRASREGGSPVDQTA